MQLSTYGFYGLLLNPPPRIWYYRLHITWLCYLQLFFHRLHCFGK